MSTSIINEEGSWIDESIQESIGFSQSMAKMSLAAIESSQKIKQKYERRDHYISEDSHEQSQSSSVIDDFVGGESYIKSSIMISNSNFSKSRQDRGIDSMAASKSKINTYEQSMLEREEREKFIDKKFNKIRRDYVYGNMKDMHNNIRKKEYK